MNKHTKIPKNLGLKIGSKDEAAWTSILQQAQAAIDDGKRAIIINQAIVKLAEEEIALAKQKV